jgi:LacI family transcriptional regulator
MPSASAANSVLACCDLKILLMTMAKELDSNRKTGKSAMRRTPRPTMTDVAKLAGVSQSTVSMVLNNVTSARLSPETRSKVLDAALSLGYQLAHTTRPDPALLLKSLQMPQGKSPDVRQRRLIVYLVDEISTSPHPVVSVDGARDAAWENDCVLSVAVTHGNPEQEKAIIETALCNPLLLGFIYSAIFTRRVQLPAALTDIPTVLLNCHDESQKHPTVVPGELSGGHAATEHLINAGHERIGFINGEPWMEAAKDRLKGYRRALATADLPYDPALVRDGDWMSGTGFDATLSLMAQPRPPTAIFCANDLMAVGALEALKTLNLRVPDDVSLMGYDDQEISRHTHPPLTTVLLPNYEMGRSAVDSLLGEIHQTHGTYNSGSKSRRLLLKVDCPLVERQSVARITPPPDASPPMP